MLNGLHCGQKSKHITYKTIAYWLKNYLQTYFSNLEVATQKLQGMWVSSNENKSFFSFMNTYACIYRSFTIAFILLKFAYKEAVGYFILFVWFVS